ncbi:MAG: hypothetical protein MUE30_15045 [Spirosomaceae bacterium]|jgi:hypothetical protein|nr:hypothetical protein [Spirosomataceae bacterium]
MKRFYKSAAYCLLMSGLLLTACEEKKDPKMEEAGKIHLAAMEVEEAVAEHVETSDSLKTLLTEKKKTLTDAAAVASIDSTIAALDRVHAAFHEWEENLVEVPGLPHEHHDHGDGGHQHDHKPAPDLSPDQMLEVQKEIKANIEKIKADWDKAQEMVKKVL